MSTVRKKHTSTGDKKARVKKVLARLEKVHADAKLDLDFRNPLELLIALILAAQARDDLVNKITVGLFKSRSEERRVGKECERLCRSRWSPYH